MGRDAAAVLLTLDWTPVLVALITVIGTFFNTALIAWFYYRVRPPSGRHPGRTLEDAAQTGHANNALLTLLLKEHGIAVPEKDG